MKHNMKEFEEAVELFYWGQMPSPERFVQDLYDKSNKYKVTKRRILWMNLVHFLNVILTICAVVFGFNQLARELNSVIVNIIVMLCAIGWIFLSQLLALRLYKHYGLLK